MLIIDRISKDIAVIEDGERLFEVPRKMLSEDACEGDVIALRNEKYVKDKNATDERRKKIIEMQNNLWE